MIIGKNDKLVKRKIRKEEGGIRNRLPVPPYAC
jgi:hypothetical protein